MSSLSKVQVMCNVRILAFAGSTRKDSYNDRLVRIAVEGAESAGADVTYLNLRDFPMPLFDEDLESDHGPPEHAQRLKNLFLEHDALLLACPEYNSSITPLLKNAIDWVSRPAPGEPRLAAYQNKSAALLSASPGGLGGLRGLVHVRAILGNIGVMVLPQQIAVGSAFEAFDEQGGLKDQGRHQAVQDLGRQLAEATRKWKS